MSRSRRATLFYLRTESSSISARLPTTVGFLPPIQTCPCALAESDRYSDEVGPTGGSHLVKQARAQRTRETIIQAAGSVFARSSLASATLKDVIDEAGVTQGALYFHFGSKQDLALEVIARQHRLSIELGDQFIRDGTPGLEAIVSLSARLAEQIVGNPVVQGGLRLTTESSGEFDQQVQHPYVDWINATEVLLHRAARDGTVLLTLAPREMAQFLISTFTGVQTVSRALTNWKDLPDRVVDMWKLLFPVILTDQSANMAQNLLKLSRPRATSPRATVRDNSGRRSA